MGKCLNDFGSVETCLFFLGSIPVQQINRIRPAELADLGIGVIQVSPIKLRGIRGYFGEVGSSPLLVVMTELKLIVSSTNQIQLYHTFAVL